MSTFIEGSYTVPADRTTVWIKLNDPAVLKRCISGCDSMEKTSDTAFVATARTKVGPIRVSIRGRIDLQDVDAPRGCRIVAEGTGGIAGFASGSAQIRLAEVPDGTAVSYVVEANVGGRLAKLGGRLIGGVATRMADRFFTAFVVAIGEASRPIAATRST